MLSVAVQILTDFDTSYKLLNLRAMDFEKLKQKAFVFIGDNDEYAKIIPDGNVNEAAKLMADFVHNLWECGEEYNPDTSESNCNIPHVIGCLFNHLIIT